MCFKQSECLMLNNEITGKNDRYSQVERVVERIVKVIMNVTET